MFLNQTSPLTYTHLVYDDDLLYSDYFGTMYTHQWTLRDIRTVFFYWTLGGVCLASICLTTVMLYELFCKVFAFVFRLLFRPTMTITESEEDSDAEKDEDDNDTERIAVIVRGLPGTGKKKALTVFLRETGLWESSFGKEDPPKNTIRIHYWKRQMYENGEYHYQKYRERECIDRSLDGFYRSIQRNTPVVCIIDYFSSMDMVYTLMQYALDRDYYVYVLDVECPETSEEFQRLYDVSRHKVPLQKTRKIARKYEEFDEEECREAMDGREDEYTYIRVPYHTYGGRPAIKEAILSQVLATE